MSKHTPGPWIIDVDAWKQVEVRSGNERDTDEDGVVYVIARSIGGRIHGEEFDDRSEVEANIRLIAEAPEFISIAERLVKWDTDYPVNCENGYAGLKALNEIIDDAKKSISKVEGAK